MHFGVLITCAQDDTLMLAVCSYWEKGIPWPNHSSSSRILKRFFCPDFIVKKNKKYNAMLKKCSFIKYYKCKHLKTKDYILDFYTRLTYIITVHQYSFCTDEIQLYLSVFFSTSGKGTFAITMELNNFTTLSHKFNKLA